MPNPSHTDDQNEFAVELVETAGQQFKRQPENAILLEGYALRLLEQGDLTPKEMSLWVGFRQAVHRQWESGKGAVKNIPYWEALQFAAMSRASYFREVTGKDILAGGLVEVVKGSGERQHDRRFAQSKKYRIHMQPRLTQQDCAVMEDILTAALREAGSNEAREDIVLAVMMQLLKTEPAEFLNRSIGQIQKYEKPSTQASVLRALGSQGALSGELRSASEKVFEHILRGFGEFLIPRDFLQNATDKYSLTHPQIWAITFLRARSFYTRGVGATLLRGGWEELGSWVGVSSKTVKRWAKDSSFRAFVAAVEIPRAETTAFWDSRTAVFLVRQDGCVERKDEAGGQIQAESQSMLMRNIETVLGALVAKQVEQANILGRIEFWQ